MADQHGHGGDSKAASWGAALASFALGLFVLFVVVNGIVNRFEDRPFLHGLSGSSAPSGAPFVPLTSGGVANAPTTPKGTQWVNNGKNPQCAGKMRGSPFTCISPITHQSTTCWCD